MAAASFGDPFASCRAVDTTVGEAKRRIEAATGLPQKLARLVFKGEELDDDRTLSSLNIGDGKLLLLQDQEPPHRLKLVVTNQDVTSTKGCGDDHKDDDHDSVATLPLDDTFSSVFGDDSPRLTGGRDDHKEDNHDSVATVPLGGTCSSVLGGHIPESRGGPNDLEDADHASVGTVLDTYASVFGEDSQVFPATTMNQDEQDVE